MVIRDKYLNRIVVAVFSAPEFERETGFVRHSEMSIKVRFKV